MDHWTEQIPADADPTSTKERLDKLRKSVTTHEGEDIQQALEKVFGPHFKWDDSVIKTAGRILKFWREYSPELPIDQFPFNLTKFKSEYNQMISVRDIQFSSVCMHHLLPFYGLAHVAYIPNQYQIGLSKIPRIVLHIAKRPQVQENLTGQIAKVIKSTLAAQGVMVVVEARHTCMSCRGVSSFSASMTTSDLKGVFLTNSAARDEFLMLIGRRGI